MTSNIPIVSVVTPVYNGADHLRECIDSVLAQSYSHFEYVIVDNQSTDDTLAIAQEYARRDDRIKIIRTPEHYGVIRNWNFALSAIDRQSRYCKVVHADDWIKPLCLERMILLARAYPSVGIVGAHRLEGDHTTLGGIPRDQPATSGRQIGADVLEGRASVFGSPTSLLLRSDLIFAQDPFYDESLLHADKEICFRLLQCCDFGFVHETLTFTRRHERSVTSAVKQLATRRLENLLLLQRYGEYYLGKERYAERWREEVGSYYRFLARVLLEGRQSEEFWNYHRTGLERLGVQMSYLKLARQVIHELLNVAGTARKIRHRMSTRANGAHGGR